MKISVQVKFSKISKVVFENNIYFVYTSQKPVNWKANEDIIYQISKYFNIPKSNVKLVWWKKSKIKVLEINKKSP